jgi:methyl-accepting chemotaxis protein
MLFGKRKIYFIQKEFQARFILRFVAVSAVWAAATVTLFAWLAERRLEELRFSSHIDITTTSELLLPATVGAHVVSLIIFSCILAYTIFSLWKRLSPPLSAIKKEIARIAGGELTHQIILPENDEFLDLATALDGMRHELRENFMRVKEAHRILNASVAELSRSVDKGASSAGCTGLFQSAVARMKEHVQTFRY